jgi:G3E family GTPase
VDADGVWTLDLRSWRPLHPERLRHRIGDLGGGARRSRGRFWLPTRPSTTCCWDGAGGQLSIGSVGPWLGNQPSTRLVVTGIDDPSRVEAAFDEVLLSDAELAKGLSRWQGTDDGFDPWLGEPAAA